MQSSIFARPISCASNYSHKWKLNKCSYFQDLIFAVTIKSAETSTKCLFLLSCLLCFLEAVGGGGAFASSMRPKMRTKTILKCIVLWRKTDILPNIIRMFYTQRECVNTMSHCIYTLDAKHIQSGYGKSTR